MRCQIFATVSALFFARMHFFFSEKVSALVDSIGSDFVAKMGEGISLWEAIISETRLPLLFQLWYNDLIL